VTSTNQNSKQIKKALIAASAALLTNYRHKPNIHRDECVVQYGLNIEEIANLADEYAP